MKFDEIPSSDFLVMTDPRFVNGQLLIFNCDLDLGHGKLNFGHDIPTHFA